ncbi:F-box/LRR-repeat protein [Cardamine amara subsp. amara]|uniref:F-box/LRR-repeat protein n=1 Tax=Cardamine amara subsp. amara TaxID=228776 RepID=A0ABD0Z505_CARAN
MDGREKFFILSSPVSQEVASLWTLVPNLNDDSVFLHPEEGKGKRDGIRQSFVDFVDRILAMQGDSPIEKFSLKCITGVHPDTVNRWICNVLQRGVSDLNLFIDFSYEDIEDGYYLPREMFVSKTLVELKIRSEHSVDLWTVGEATFLPMLKTLDVDSDLIYCGKVEMLLSYFPVLENLRMANMVRMESHETVSSASLKKLTLSIQWEDYESPKSISFDTPSLLYLNYSDLVADDYPLVNMKNLVEGRINFMADEDQIEQARAPDNDLLANDEEAIVLPFDNVMKLMNGIQNVQRLYLASDTLEVLSLCGKSMPVFNNVKILYITSDEGRAWQAMPDLLRNCPNLEYLVMEGLLHYVTDKCGDFCDCIARGDKGRSLTSCPVTKLEIRGFKGTMREINMIRHFLRFFRCLKEVGIFPEEDDPTNFENPGVFELVEKILNLYHDEFSSCDVVFLVDNHLRRKWTAQSSLRV